MYVAKLIKLEKPHLNMISSLEHRKRKLLICNMHKGKAWGLILSSLNVNKVLETRKRNVKVLFVLSAFFNRHINYFYIKRKVINLEFRLIPIRERASFLKRVFFYVERSEEEISFSWRKINRNPSRN